MEAVYPQNYPELGDFHAALADALTSFLEKRGQTLPKKTKSQNVRLVAVELWITSWSDWC